MLKEDLERLAWQRIDGDISQEDRERLEKLEAEDPEVRRDMDGLRVLSEALARFRKVPPPPELRPRIDRAVASSSPGWRRSAPVVNLWRPRLAYLAAGLLVGAVVARLLLPVSDRQIDADRVTGAMRAAPIHAVDGLQIDLEGGRGTLSQWRDGALLMTALDLSTNLAVDLVLEADDGVLDLLNALHSGGSTSELLVEEHRLVVHAAGVGRHVVAVAPAGEDTSVSAIVVSGGNLLASQRVALSQLGDK
jgi:hypothetical protein